MSHPIPTPPVCRSLSSIYYTGGVGRGTRGLLPLVCVTCHLLYRHRHLRARCYTSSAGIQHRAILPRAMPEPANTQRLLIYKTWHPQPLIFFLFHHSLGRSRHWAATPTFLTLPLLGANACCAHARAHSSSHGDIGLHLPHAPHAYTARTRTRAHVLPSLPSHTLPHICIYLVCARAHRAYHLRALCGFGYCTAHLRATPGTHAFTPPYGSLHSLLHYTFHTHRAIHLTTHHYTRTPARYPTVRSLPTHTHTYARTYTVSDSFSLDGERRAEGL